MTLQQFNERLEALRKSPQCRLNADQILVSPTLARTIMEASIDLHANRKRYGLERTHLSKSTRDLVEQSIPFDFILAGVLHWIEHGIILQRAHK